jgi:hypothetical protein
MDKTIGSSKTPKTLDLIQLPKKPNRLRSFDLVQLPKETEQNKREKNEKGVFNPD